MIGNYEVHWMWRIATENQQKSIMVYKNICKSATKELVSFMCPKWNKINFPLRKVFMEVLGS